MHLKKIFLIALISISFHLTAYSAQSIAIIAPSYGAPASELAQITKLLRTNGFDVHFNENTITHPTALNYAASKTIRLETLKAALNDDQIDIIWALRGGYGAFELLEALKNMPEPTKKKLLIGFSDTTHLHLFIKNQWGWDSLHAPCLKFNKEINSKTNGKTSLKEIFSFIQNKEVNYTLTPFNKAAMTQITPLNAEIIGGNLSVLTANLGHFNQPNFKNRIILLEEIAESPQKIMRMLTQLKLAGAFHDCSGIILGAFIKTSSQTTPLLKKFFSKLNKPCFQTNLFGHGDFNKPLPLGRGVTLNPGGDLRIPSHP